MTVSVCTLSHGRKDHLANLVRGLNYSSRPPLELIIAVMQETRYELPASSFPVRQVVLGKSGMCLAEARNLAAAKARGDLLVFLDVDCIPAPRLIEDYCAASALNDGVLMGEVGYLPKGATEQGIDYQRFERQAVEHSERAGPPRGMVARCGDYRCFWSLNFALTATMFHTIGGFDPRYVGYGGEDTDFGRTLVSKDVPLWWARGAKAYHQYHKHHMPPVHHLDSVVQNAQIFTEKWGEPTMQHWLRAFRLMGLIEPDGRGGWIKLKEPGEADLALTRQQENQPYASSALVLDALEDQERRGREARRAPSITLA